jgi:hypothetical protein
MKKAIIFWLVLLVAAGLFPHASNVIRAAKNLWADLRPGLHSGEQTTEAANDQEERLQAEIGSRPQSDIHSELLGINGGPSVVSREPKDSDASQGGPDAALDSEKLAQAAADIPDSELREALASMLDQRGSYNSQLRDLLVRRWAESDPKAAASWASGVQDSSPAAAITKQVAMAWANNDLSAAVEWIESLPENEARKAAVLGLGYEAARSNSFEGFDLVAALPPSAERDALLVHITRQWAAADPSEAALWAERVPDAGLRERLLAATAIASATKDPSAAASLIATNLSPGRAQDQAAVAIVQRWAQTNSQAAGSWVSLFPDSAVKVAASQALSSVERAPSAESK